MPRSTMIWLSLLVLGCVTFLAYQIKELRRRNRNVKHWERDEPLEGAGEWD